MKKILIFFIIVSTSIAFAQIEDVIKPQDFHNPEDSTLKQGWNPFGVVGLNLSQVAFKNWTQGGSNSLAFVAYTNLGLLILAIPGNGKIC
jgi:hypothetical protein